jgi:beta-glucanase (GH16 family)
MRAGRVVAGVVVVLLAAGAAFAYVQYFRKTEQTISVALLPGIAQPGDDPAASDEAAGIVTATITPAEEGRPVLLQARVGGSWQGQQVGNQDVDGTVEFPLEPGGLDEGQVYRVVSYGDDALERADSKQLSGDQWGRPDFADEFNRDVLGDEWLNRGEDYNVEGLRACSKGSGDAVGMKDGNLELSVIYDPERADETCSTKHGPERYRLNGHVTTNGHFFRYGVLAARIKFQKSRGQHASLWMQPAISESKTDAATGGAEIDVIEWFGEGVPNGGLTSFVYHPTADGLEKEGDWIPDPDRFLSGPGDTWYDSYHVFSVEWTPDEYVFRIDGKETFRTSEGVSGQPEYPILSLLSSDYELRKLKDNGLPQTMYVDWLKFWES